MSGKEKIEIDEDTEMPSRAWEGIRVHQQYIKGPHLDPSTPITEDKIRFVCISDTHGKIERSPLCMPPGDVLLHAGDFTMRGQMKEIEKFDSYLGYLPYKVKVVIAGNHDLTLDDDLSQLNMESFGISKSDIKTHLKSKGIKSVKQMLSHAVYLQDSSVSICGIKIYGSPWSPRHVTRMGFQCHRGQEIKKCWDQMPSDIDILISHTPPCGHGDISGGDNNSGCVELLNTVQKRVKPKYHVFGHIHEGYGVTSDGYTVFINASICNKKYQATNPPIVFDYAIPEGHNKEELLYMDKDF
ncbi:metallophosphoesterase domain-containing protein 1-like isoform X1 [Ostrea edulis]|uniref:metallophosphoesterase domain-containing protein 1-like isoform X1 n=1 Tax=Ostrea edulis TaxID=37623 RepID=UPI0024AF09EA|nr:metallophosphoesterase domain-containing protein 1-like isoform X1 [Ostrea edulis]